MSEKEKDLFDASRFGIGATSVQPPVDLFGTDFRGSEEVQLPVRQEDTTAPPYQLDVALFHYFVEKYPESSLNNVEYFRNKVRKADQPSSGAQYKRMNAFVAQHCPAVKNDEFRMGGVVFMQDVLSEVTQCMDEANFRHRRGRDHTILIDPEKGVKREIFIHIDPTTKDRRMLIIGDSYIEKDKKESVLLTFPGSEELKDLYLPIAQFDVLTPEQIQKALSNDSGEKFFKLGELSNINPTVEGYVAPPKLLFGVAETFRNFAADRAIEPSKIANWNKIMTDLENSSKPSAAP
jgi:hypothetical protein